MSHTRPVHPALRVVGEVISEHIISEVLLDEKKRTHVVVGDHPPEPRVEHSSFGLSDIPRALACPAAEPRINISLDPLVKHALTRGT